MFEKNLKLAYLLDFYGEVLDNHTRHIMNAYYDDDLSLSEIADGIGISRQGVRHVIKKGEEQLEFLEEKLGLATRYSELATLCNSLTMLKDKLLAADNRELRDDCKALERAIDLILNRDL